MNTLKFIPLRLLILFGACSLLLFTPSFAVAAECSDAITFVKDNVDENTAEGDLATVLRTALNGADESCAADIFKAVIDESQADLATAQGLGDVAKAVWPNQGAAIDAVVTRIFSPWGVWSGKQRGAQSAVGGASGGGNPAQTAALTQEAKDAEAAAAAAQREAAAARRAAEKAKRGTTIVSPPTSPYAMGTAAN